MRLNANPQQPALEDFTRLLDEIQASSTLGQLNDALRHNLKEFPGLSSMLVTLGQDVSSDVEGEDTAAQNNANLDWVAYPIKTSMGDYGELKVCVTEPTAIAQYHHLISTLAGLIALRIENIELIDSTTAVNGKPDPHNVVEHNHPGTKLRQAQADPQQLEVEPAERNAEDLLGKQASTEVSENLYKLIAQHTSDSIWAMDSSLKFTYLSPSTERIYGYTIREWHTLDWGVFVHPNDIDGINQMYAGFTSGSRRNSHSSIIRVFHKNGKEMWVEFTASPVFDDAGDLMAVVGVSRDITSRKHFETALERRVLALTQPLDDPKGLAFEDLLNLDEIQTLQDEFAAATGVASIITNPDGTPITKPSQFTYLCNEIIRKTEKGCANCYKSDANLGSPNSMGPTVQPCLSGGLWDAGASITLGGRHIANWLIGQVRDETQTEDKIIAYGKEIGADEQEILEAFRKVPSMSRVQFEKVAQALFTLANQLSTMAYQNVQQARFISERKHSEDQLRASEQAHRSLIEALPDIVMRISPEGRCLFASDNISDLFGLPASEFVNKSSRELGFPEELCEYWEQKINRAFTSRLQIESEFEMETALGHAILNWRIVPETDDHGEVRSLLSMTRDVTAQRKAERDYQILFREMFEGFALLKVIENHDGQVEDFQFLAINPSFERMTGISSTEMVGKNIRTILKPERIKSWDVMVRVAQTGKPEHFDSDSREIGKHFEVTIFKPAPGQIAAILMDVTARKRAEAERLKMERQIQHAQKLESLGVLAGGIAHDFNNILFAILGNASMSLEMLAEDHPVRSMIEEISICGERASDLVRRILTFARRTERQRSNLDFMPLIKEVTKLMRATLPANVVINLELGSQKTTTFADASEIQQILLNLCTNAGYAMQAEGGTLTIRLHDQRPVKPPHTTAGQPECGPFYVIEVEDTGPGIPRNIQERMFDPFYTTKPVGEGTGMGLALVQSITTDLGGWIEVESEVGKGTTFSVFLPFVQDTEANHESSKRRDVPTGNEYLMVVDDEKSIASLLTRYLQKLGYEVSMFTSSTNAAAYFAEHPKEFDLAILDQTMPDLTGKDLAAQLRSLRPGLPIIIATGYSSTFTMEQAAELGIMHYIEKPVVLHELALKVRDALDTRSPDSSTRNA